MKKKIKIEAEIYPYDKESCSSKCLYLGNDYCHLFNVKLKEKEVKKGTWIVFYNIRCPQCLEAERKNKRAKLMEKIRKEQEELKKAQLVLLYRQKNKGGAK